MKKIVMSMLALGLVAATASEDKSPALLSGGKVSGQIKVFHILNDKRNSFTPEDGSAYLGKLKYVTKDLGLKGLKAGAAFYINGDTGLTNWDKYYMTPTTSSRVTTVKNAQGLFTAPKGETQTLLGEFYLEYGSEFVDAKIGRQILNTPLTTIKWSTMPNFYEAAVLTIKPAKAVSFTLAHVNKMSYGARTAADFGLIGEKTGTAGIVRPTIAQSSTSGIPQAKFMNLGRAAGVKYSQFSSTKIEETKGLTATNLTLKPIEGLSISGWNYYAHDIANIVYADIGYSFAAMKGTKLSFDAQYLTEDETGRKLAGKLDYTLRGAKIGIGSKKWSLYAAYNDSSSRGEFINPWGSDPAYTSSLFSRNAYRKDVSAYKIGGHYTVIKGLKLIASYADYGRSKTSGWVQSTTYAVTAVKDATEANFIIAYKPTNALTLKLMNAFRTSEYDGAMAINKKTKLATLPVERRMAHTRFIASYEF